MRAFVKIVADLLEFQQFLQRDVMVQLDRK